MSMSSESQKKWRREHRHPCLDCGVLVEVRAKRCKSCSRKHQRRENHPNWKGGRVALAGGARGYIGILKPDHPRANKGGYVLEHILVWEEAHGKPLPKGWIIHHLNGIKNDNRPSNLIALPNKKHYLVLQAKAKRIQELEALLNNQSQLL